MNDTIKVWFRVGCGVLGIISLLSFIFAFLRGCHKEGQTYPSIQIYSITPKGNVNQVQIVKDTITYMLKDTGRDTISFQIVWDKK